MIGVAFIAPREAYMSGSGQAVHTSAHFRVTASTPHKRPVDPDEYNRRIAAWQGRVSPFLRNLSGLVELNWAQVDGREMAGAPGNDAGRRLIVADKKKAIASPLPFYYQVEYSSRTYPDFTARYVFELLFTKTPESEALTGLENNLLRAIDLNFEYARVLSCPDKELRSSAQEDLAGKTDAALKEFMKGMPAYDPAGMKRWKNFLLLAAVESNSIERAGFWLKEGADVNFGYAYPVTIIGNVQKTAAIRETPYTLGMGNPEMLKFLISNGAKKPDEAVKRAGARGR